MKIKNIIVLFLFFVDLQLLCQSNPFGKNREKGAIFKYEKKDFDSMFFSIFQRNPHTYSGDFNIESKMVISIDSIGNVKEIVFKLFVFESYYTSDNMFERTIYNKGKIYADVKSELRRVLYTTNGLWLPKLDGNKTQTSSILLNMKFKSSDLFQLIENPETDVFYQNVIANNLALSDSLPVNIEKKCKNYVDSLKTNKVSWRIEVDNYSNNFVLQNANNYLLEKKYDLAKAYFMELNRRFPEMEKIKKLIIACN